MSNLPQSEDELAIESLSRSLQSLKDSPRTIYSKLRNTREQATFNLMMRMAPSALEAIRKEFYKRGDSVSLYEFIFIMSKHLLQDYALNSENNAAEKKEFGSYMFELFKEVDVNGDGQMEWEEFTKFTVEKASLLNKRLVLTSIPVYEDCTASLDPQVRMHRRNQISKMIPIQNTGTFAVIEEHRKVLSIYNTFTGAFLSSVQMESVPLSVAHIKEHNQLLVSSSNMSLTVVQLDDHLQKRYQQQTNWFTPQVQMSLAWMPSNELLYSGSNNGKIYSWKYQDRNLIATMPGHSDIVMNLLALDQLDNLVSASLDTTIGVWDTYTNSIIHKLRGHKKGVFSMSYNSDFRLLVSCGFDHDAFVWSPFVNSLVYKLKGHHASLVGCQSVENSPEVVTADESGVFKVWDVRTFQCVQTFFHNSSSETEPPESLSCFFHTKLTEKDKIKSKSFNINSEARIFGGAKGVHCFDQKRIVHEKTSDFSNVIWLALNPESSTIITASTHNIIIWDMLLGSKLLTHNNICGEEISACCLDDRKRKIIIGDILGQIKVYNPLNGSYMKSCPHDIKSVVLCLSYINDCHRFIAGFSNGIIRLHDESNLDDCNVIRVFDAYNIHPELLSMSYSAIDRTLVTSGSVGQLVKLWDYDTGKCDLEIDAAGPEETIIAVCCFTPFPLIATSDTRGNVIVWGSRGCKWRGVKITGFLNHNPVNSVVEPLSKADASNGIPARVIPETNADANASIDCESDYEDIVSTDNTASVDTKGSIEEKASTEASLSVSKWGPIAAATCLSWDQDTHFLYTGDELGHLRRWSLHDVIEELGGSAMNYGAKSYEPQKNVRVFKRGHSSALIPVGLNNLPFMIGKKNLISFMGVKFCWMIQAHEEGILALSWHKEGILTSSTDNLVKMWTKDGRPVGTLLHSVPVGLRSQNWDLNINVVEIMKKEDSELREILNVVDEIAFKSQSDKAEELEEADATKFSRSSLRKRIEMSGKILGLDFNGDLDTIPEAYDTEEQSIASMQSNTTKSSRVALEELKEVGKLSADTKKDLAQVRRKEHSMEKVAEKFKVKGLTLPKLTVPEEVDKSKAQTLPMKRLMKQMSSMAVRPLVEMKASSRTVAMNNKCAKYATYGSLEAVLDPNNRPSPTADQIATRKMKKVDSAAELKAHFEQVERRRLIKLQSRESTKSMSSLKSTPSTPANKVVITPKKQRKEVAFEDNKTPEKNISSDEDGDEDDDQ